VEFHPTQRGSIRTAAASPYTKRHPRMWEHLVGDVDALGHWVPVEHLERAVGARRTHVRQLSLLPAGEGWLVEPCCICEATSHRT
jgi:hypothetical protein